MSTERPSKTKPSATKECKFAPLTKPESWTFSAPDGRLAIVEHTVWFNARALALAELSRTAPPGSDPLEPSDLTIVSSPHDPKPSGTLLSTYVFTMATNYPRAGHHPVAIKIQGRVIQDGDNRVGYIGSFVRLSEGVNETRWQAPDGETGIWNGGDKELDRLWEHAPKADGPAEGGAS